MGSETIEYPVSAMTFWVIAGAAVLIIASIIDHWRKS